MAIYHFEAKVITRGVGRSVVAAAAYASCSEIYNDYDGVNHDYTKKGGLVHSEVLLPPNAPTEWQERAELWNAVESAEKSKDSRLARELIVALPVELQSNEWITMLRDFISVNCVSKGMCADYSIHDTDGHNPHAHILLTVRPLDEKGKRQSKTQKEYICKRGNEERGFTADEFKAVQSDGWEKQYQYFVGKKKVYMTPTEAERYSYERVSKNPKSTRYGRQNPICAEWNSDEQIIKWRKAWEDVTNLALEQRNIAERVDCRSFKERGIDEQPTIHEGVTARIMEKCGLVSDRCELNRQIRKDNALLQELKTLVEKLSAVVENTVAKIAEKLENIWTNLVGAQYELKHNKNAADSLTHNNIVIDVLLRNFNSIKKEIVQKTDKLKKLKSDKENLNPIHIFRHNQLSEEIDKQETDIERLKNRRAVLLDDMGCKTEADIPKVKSQHKKNDISLKNISARNAELNEQKEIGKSEYTEIKRTIPPEDIAAVYEERRNIRAYNEKSLSKRLQEKFGRDYSYDDLREAETEINGELGEKPFPKKSMRKYLQQKQREAEKTQRGVKKRGREYER